MKKNVVILTLILLLVMVLTGCSDGFIGYDSQEASGTKRVYTTLSTDEKNSLEKEIWEDKSKIKGFWVSADETLCFLDEELLRTTQEKGELLEWTIDLVNNKKVVYIDNINYQYILEDDELSIDDLSKTYKKIDRTVELVDLKDKYVFDESQVDEKNNGISFEGDENYAPAGERVDVYYKSTRTKYYIGALRNRKKNGSGTIYYENGYEKKSATFKNDVLEGSCTEYFFHPERIIKTVSNYKNGELNGPYVSYFINGNKEFEGSYKNGRKQGDFIEYYENGNIKRSGTYSNPLFGSYGINGDMKEYDEQGRLMYDGKVKEGKYHGKGKLFHSENGKLKYKGNFFDGLYDGKGTLYNIDGKVLYEGKFKDGVFIE